MVSETDDVCNAECDGVREAAALRVSLRVARAEPELVAEAVPQDDAEDEADGVREATEVVADWDAEARAESLGDLLARGDAETLADAQ